MKRMIGAQAVLTLFLVAWAQSAQAHILPAEATGFSSGVLHPFSGLDHVVAMVCVGVWGAQLGAPAIWILPVVFPVMMAFGGLVGFLGVSLPGTEVGIALSMIVLGGAVMLRARLQLAPVIAIVAFFAIFHGYAHGMELPSGESALLYSVGFVLATAFLHLIGIAIGLIYRATLENREFVTERTGRSGAGLLTVRSRAMTKTILAFLLATGSLLALSAAVPVNAQQAGAAQSTGDGVIYLNQAWSQEDREWYYHFSQGSAVLSYDIFLNLEAADSQDLFRFGLNSTRYGLIPEAANSYNPDGLPIGIGKTVVATPVKGWPAGDYAGLTCAACHEGQLRYKGKLIRIEAGISHTADLQGLIRGLDDALQATLTDATKFDRLAGRLGASSPDAKDKLRKRAESETERVDEYATRTSVTPHPWGPGRMDAITMIVDRVTATLTGIHENWSAGIAPTKPPFLWNAPHGLWTQWRASAQDPIGRNFGEAMGVYMPVDLSSKSPAEGLFQSNAAILELQRVENQLERLAPPSWPEEVLGKIDREKAKVGKALFMENCASCHNAWPYRWTEPNKYGKRFVLVGLVPQTYVGTDKTQFEALRPLAISGELSKFFPPEFRGKPLVPPFVFSSSLSVEALETALRKLKLTEAQEANLHGYRERPTARPPENVYKAAPRDGVWATAPLLHNGSVPNLYEMLIPAAERTKKFYLGGDFDPVRVGLDTTATSGTFLMDTTLLGNSNAGHSFQDGPRGDGVIGPLLTEDERWALVEYLKSIPEEPGRVTPFGGPPAN